MLDSILLVVVGIFVVTYTMARIADIAERSKRRQLARLVEEARKRRIKSLYGREDE